MNFAAELLTPSHFLNKPDFSSSSSAKISDPTDSSCCYYMKIVQCISGEGIPTEKKSTMSTSKDRHQLLRKYYIDNFSDEEGDDGCQQEDQQENKRFLDEASTTVSGAALHFLELAKSGATAGLQPGANDVLSGRRATIRKHCGNIVYTQLVEANKPLYKSCEQYVRPLVAKSIVAALSLQGGRFLKQTTQGEWVDIGVEAALSKTVMRLRKK